MGRIRVIPVLLVKGSGLYKGVKFKNHTYIGDPINAVKIFNDKEVDELIVIDIGATLGNKVPDFSLISRIAGEAFMPLGYGGGIKSLDQIKRIFYEGVEKVVINTSAHNSTALIESAAKTFGSQSVVVSIDIKKNLFGKIEVYTHSGTINTHKDPVQFAKEMESAGAGELFFQSIDKDGTFAGYDLPTLKKITDKVSIPVIAGCGASGLEDFKMAISEGGASAVAAGSLFVFVGKTKGVLINYLSNNEINQLNNG
ncbi:MAG: AglZ/HisF2 family acetamidino modification protein [Cytophagaceae bacterium]|jgi:cyclase|nr:AglZ/HisF2 family acetamidino modification protein [Cytophagaceae bacterium]